MAHHSNIFVRTYLCIYYRQMTRFKIDLCQPHRPRHEARRKRRQPRTTAHCWSSVNSSTHCGLQPHSRTTTPSRANSSTRSGRRPPWWEPSRTTTPTTTTPLRNQLSTPCTPVWTRCSRKKARSTHVQTLLTTTTTLSTAMTRSLWTRCFHMTLEEAE
jgi:hypothetical protein